MSEMIVFHALAGLITLCSFMVVASKNPVASAIFLVLDLFLLAGMFALLEAHFVAVIQILVYAGAIVVLFLFVIMLLNLSPDASKSAFRLAPVEIGALCITFLGFLVMGILALTGKTPDMFGTMTPERIEQAGGNTYMMGLVLFTEYVWPFELASVLILMAMVAAIVIAKREKTSSASPLGQQSAGRKSVSGTH